jgi:ATP-dependent DNA ligase
MSGLRREGKRTEIGPHPSPLLCECVLLKRAATPLTLFVFVVLSVEGEPVVSPSYRERRVLEELRLDGTQWRTTDAFDEGEALSEAVCEHELEGVVAKRRSGRNVSGRRVRRFV